MDNVEYKFARCCNPVYGDDIIGFVSIGEGIKVHRRQCKNALELVRRYPYRIVKTRWTNDGATSYQTVLNLTGKEDGNIIKQNYRIDRQRSACYFAGHFDQCRRGGIRW